MSESKKVYCPECEEHVEPAQAVDRRNFIRVVGSGTAASLVAAGSVAAPSVAATTPPAPSAATPRPAEALIQELYRGLTNEQRQDVVHAWNHGQSNNQLPMRMRMVNRPFDRRIGEVYTPAQQELLQQILRAISSGEDGYAKLTRNGTFDGSRSFQGCGADIFGDPTSGQYAWVFTGHHITVRCDGNSVPGAAFGGPMYYGHSPNGYSQRNCFYYQTQSVRRVFDALSEAQRRQAVVGGSPGEHEPSVQFRPAGEARPGLPGSELTNDQIELVEEVMRTILSPYRQEDADEVMQIVRQNGGLQQVNLAFYQENNNNDPTRWRFWRLEGPGFVWNYRVLPHVHTYVNIARQT